MFLIVLFVICVSYFLLSTFLSRKFFITNLGSRHVFVSGCDSGFGHFLVLKLSEKGVPTFAGCLTEHGRKELSEKCKFLRGKLWTLSIDVTNDESTKEAADFVEKELNATNDKLWAVVCNAGIGSNLGPDDWLHVDDYKKVAEVNTFGLIRTCHSFKPLIKKSKGRIVIVTSMGGRIVGPFLGPYCVSKFAAEAYGDVIRLEAKLFGYSVHLIEPGFVNTPLVQEMANGFDKLWNRLNEDIKTEYGSNYCKKATISQRKAFNLVTSSNLSNVVDTYYEALFSRFPKRRYAIGLDANFLYRPLTLMPTHVQDFFIGLQTVITGHPPLPASYGQY